MNNLSSIMSSIFLQKENEHRSSAKRALAKVKKIEEIYLDKMVTVVLSNGTIVSCNNKERLNEYIKKYGKREL